MPSRFSLFVRWLSALALVAGCGGAYGQASPVAFFLVASPKITDPNFSETVVLILQHTPLATRGIIINRPLDLPLSRLMPDNETFGKVQRPVYFGGPVALGGLGFVFRAKARHENAVQVLDDLYLSADIALLERVLQRKDGAREVRVYAGHAAWAPGQLEAEIERGSWFATTASPHYIFHEKPEDVWDELVKRASQRSVGATPPAPAAAP